MFQFLALFSQTWYFIRIWLPSPAFCRGPFAASKRMCQIGRNVLACFLHQKVFKCISQIRSPVFHLAAASNFKISGDDHVCSGRFSLESDCVKKICFFSGRTWKSLFCSHLIIKHVQLLHIRIKHYFPTQRFLHCPRLIRWSDLSSKIWNQVLCLLAMISINTMQPSYFSNTKHMNQGINVYKYLDVK